MASYLASKEFWDLFIETWLVEWGGVVVSSHRDCGVNLSLSWTSMETGTLAGGLLSSR